MDTRSRTFEATISILFEQVIDVLSELQLGSDSLTVELPTGEEIEYYDKVSLARFVSRTSNVYTKAARLTGIAKAELKLAQAAYKEAYKVSKGQGKNEAERTANAVLASKEQSDRVTNAEAVYALAESVENAARVASESARKLLDKMDEITKGEGRTTTGDEMEHEYKNQSPFTLNNGNDF